jgi:hypothetical protein
MDICILYTRQEDEEAAEAERKGTRIAFEMARRGERGESQISLRGGA